VPAGAGTAGQSDSFSESAVVYGWIRQIWSKTFEQPRGAIGALQNEIARDVSRALEAPVTESVDARFRRSRQTTPAAEEAYLQGRIHLADYGVDAARRALEAFQRAIHLDARHAAAHAGAARALVRLGTSGAIPQNNARASALAEVRRAFELDADLADAHAADADIKFLYDWDWAGAERGYQRSLELNPSFTYARTYYGQVLAARGRFDEALNQTSTAQRLDLNPPKRSASTP
jgi:tetratricopeptide (TPR) repeat protein